MKNALRIAAVVFAATSCIAAAQSTERPKPPGTQPPQPAAEQRAVAAQRQEEVGRAGPGDAPDLQPQVTVRKEAGQTIEEYRVRGKLYMMKVTPAHGHPYVLMDNKGDGTFMRQDNPLDNGVRVPQWVLMEF